MDDVLDFIILKTVYTDAFRRKWSPGDRFQSIISGRYWPGTITKKTPFSEDTPNSLWQLYHVQCDDDTTGKVSPWELHSLETNDGKTSRLLYCSLVRYSYNFTKTIMRL